MTLAEAETKFIEAIDFATSGERLTREIVVQWLGLVDAVHAELGYQTISGLRLRRDLLEAREQLA